MRRFTALVTTILFAGFVAGFAVAADGNEIAPQPRAVLNDGSPTKVEVFECPKSDQSETASYGVNRFDTGAVNLAYVEGPDHGPPLVIVPGMSVPWQSYIPAARHLCRDFHLFIVTQRGHDITGWARDRSYHVSDYGGDLVRLIENVIQQPVIVSGHSLGGLVALWLASRRPDLVIGFNAEDGAFLVQEKPRWDSEWVKPMFVGLEQRLRAFHEQGASKDRIVEMFGEADLAMPTVQQPLENRIMGLGKFLTLNGQAGMFPIADDERPRIYAAYRKFLSGETPTNAEFWPASFLPVAATASLHLDPEVAAAAVSASLVDGFDNREAFSNVTAPMLFWESDRDMVGVLSQGEVQELVGLVAQNDVPARHVYVPNSGHRIHFDAHEMFARETAKFFLKSAR